MEIERVGREAILKAYRKKATLAHASVRLMHRGLRESDAENLSQDTDVSLACIFTMWRSIQREEGAVTDA